MYLVLTLLMSWSPPRQFRNHPVVVDFKMEDGGNYMLMPNVLGKELINTPPRAPSTTATASGDDLFDEQMKASRRERLKNQRGVDIVERSLIATFIACLVYLISTTPY